MRAGYSRVTHPFAARVPRKAFPLDLHVLSTPPAFVLSQDQTLQQKPWKTNPSNKKLPKEPHQQTQKTGLPAQGTKTNLALAYKHPVEFSKNNHTPKPRTTKIQGPGANPPNTLTARQALLLPYSVVSVVSNWKLQSFADSTWLSLSRTRSSPACLFRGTW
jgi:hypothetical protein